MPLCDYSFFYFIYCMGLRKAYRLKSSKRISELFETGDKLFHYPIQSIHSTNNLPYHRIAIVVGKKKLRFAYQRNTVKRRIREQCRLLIDDFYSDSAFDIVFIYQSKKILDSSVIREGLLLHLTEVGIVNSMSIK